MWNSLKKLGKDCVNSFKEEWKESNEKYNSESNVQWRRKQYNEIIESIEIIRDRHCRTNEERK